ncbi:O-antigen ligase family protein [Rohdeia mirabilis]|uniref:O-antigen ligase family protein n=1 Tax=Rohdeia mirabilis TaxID=2528008 RepID=UPI003AF3B43C
MSPPPSAGDPPDSANSDRGHSDSDLTARDVDQPTPLPQGGSSDAGRSVSGPEPALAGSPLPSRLVAVLVAAVVVWWSVTLLDDWIGAGRFPYAYKWTSGWPLLIGCGFAVSLAIGLLRRVSLAVLATTACAAGLFPSIATELPTFSSNNYLYDGPFLMPLYAAVIVGLMLYLVAGPKSHPEHQRIVLALLIACSANTKLFVREASGIQGLLVSWAALAVVATPYPRNWWANVRASRFALRYFAVLVALLLWVGLSVALGDSLTVGTRALQSVVLGVGLAYVLAAGFGRRGVERVIGAFLVGLAVCLGIAYLGALDAASTEGWARVGNTRLRLFQSHPNIIGPYFAGTSVLCATLLLWKGPQLGGPVVRRAILLVLLAGSLVALWRTESTASMLALAVGLFVAAVVRFGPRIHRPAKLYTGIALLAVAGVGTFLSPIGAPVRAKLEAKTFEPTSAIGQRYHFWRMSARTIAYSPLVGIGPSQTYFHSRFAEPSYYDGARQTHHAHNLFLHVAEGSGLPALLLFIAALFGMIELYRRIALPMPRSALALPAALLAVPIGILASNMLDLGQVQPAYLPHYFWIHLGLGVALLSGSAARDVPPDGTNRGTLPARTAWIRAAVVVVAATPLGAFPLIADGLIQSSRLRAFTTPASSPLEDHARDAAAYRGLVLGRRFFPAHVDAYKWEPQLLENIANRIRRNRLETDFVLSEMPRTILETWEAQCRDTPSNARVWIDLARKCLTDGFLDRAGEALAQAEMLDPRGHRMGAVRLLQSWLAMARGDEAAARESLFQAALAQGTTWAMVPHQLDDRRRGELPNAKTMVFRVRTRGDELIEIPLDDILERLGSYAIEVAEDNVVEARRYMRAINAGYWKQNRPEDALVWFQRYREKVEAPISSIIKLEYELMVALGQDAEGRALIDTVDGYERERLEADLRLGRMLADDALDMDPADIAELDSFLDPLEERDIFFELGMHGGKLRAAALIYASTGRWDEAVRSTKRFLREYIDPNERRQTTSTFLTRYLMPRGMPALALLDLLETVLPDHNAHERRLREGSDGTAGSNVLDDVAAHLHLYWLPEDGDLVEVVRSRFGGSGPAADGLVLRVEQLERRARGR